MGTGRTTRSEGPGIGGPAALKAAIHVARARAGITSDVQLALRAGVSYDTLMNWFSGRTVPRPHELKKVASALAMGYGDLMDAYEGRPSEPPSLVAVVTELVAELGLQRAEFRALVEELRLGRVQQLEATQIALEALGALGRGPIPAGTPHDSAGGPRAGTRR